MKGGKTPLALAAGQTTGVIIETTGAASVFGAGSVYFVQPGTGRPAHNPGPLAWDKIPLQKVGNGQAFDLNKWQIVAPDKGADVAKAERGTGEGVRYIISAAGGTMRNKSNGELDVYNNELR